MRIVSTLALALALGGVAVSSPALAKKEEAPKVKYTPAVQNALVAVQDALKKNDTATAAAKLAEAKAAAATDDDRYITGSLEYQLYQKTKDQAQLADAVELMVGSNKAPAEQQAQLLTIQAQLAYQAKDYRKAATAAQAAIKAGATEPNLMPILVQSLSNTGDVMGALTALNTAIDQTIAAGKPVPADWFQQGISLAYKVKATDPNAQAVYAMTTPLTQKWLAAYPTKSNWHDALIIYAEQSKIPVDVQIDMFRLLRAAGALNSDADYREYAEDVYLRNPGEAKSVLEEGQKKGVLNLTGKNNASEIIAAVNGKVAGDKAALPKSEASARAAATGKTALAVGDGYMSYGEYAKAAEMYKLAISKGGPDADIAQLRLGWALASSGDTAGAKQAFAAVNGPRKALAQFWLVHLDHPTQG